MDNTNLFELRKIQKDFPNMKIVDSKSSANFIRNFYGDDLEIFESFFILTLNVQNTTTGYAKISQGGVCATVVDVKIIAKYAVEALAHPVILCHNHPSGNLTPSEQDIRLTEKVTQALKFLDIKVLDHIILTKDSYCSFSDDGLM